MPTPEELRTRSKEAAEAKRREAEKARRKAERERKALAKKVLEKHLSQWIDSVDRSIESAADNGLLTTTVAFYRYDRSDDDLYLPVLHAVEEHFEDQGFVVWASAYGGTEYGSDGAFPDGYHYPEIKVSWSDESE